MRVNAYLAGQLEPAEGDPLLSLNPSQPDDVVIEGAVGTADQAARALDAAANATWASRSGPERAEVLYRWAGKIGERTEEMAQAIAREVGKPIGEARGEVGRCVAILRYYAGECVREVGNVVPALTAGSLQYSLRQPVGPCVLITPWNFPMAIPLWKAAPALAYGNTVVLKPSELSPFCAQLLAETAHAAEVPAGVFNVLQGTGAGIGAALLDSGLAKAVSFTGSQKVGMMLAEAAARANIKFQGEMGGKNVAIVAHDADLDQAAALIAGGAFRFAGQKCTATSRVVADRRVIAELTIKLREQVAKLPLAPVTDATCAIGPLITAASREKVVGKMGTLAPVLPDLPGFFLPPTMLEDLDPDSILAQEELFAPVLAVMVADSLDQAIDIANRTPFGLSAALFTKNIGQALTYINRIEAGMVRVNGDTTGVDPHAPFGGMKGSSTHSREQGRAAIEFYTDIKTVQINP
jgi:aldehyde dehydrogenase (NAD+)